MLTDEQKEILIDCGAFGYDPLKIANIAGIEVDELRKEMGKKDSEVNKLLQKGEDLFNYRIDRKLMDLVMQGDLKALHKLETRRKKR